MFLPPHQEIIRWIIIPLLGQLGQDIDGEAANDLSVMRLLPMELEIE